MSEFIGQKIFPENDEDFSWNYYSYTCFLNTTIDLGVEEKNKYTKLNIQDTYKEIQWINFVAISNNLHTICFAGLVHKYDDDTGYRFKYWPELFENIFGFYSWN